MKALGQTLVIEILQEINTSPLAERQLPLVLISPILVPEILEQ